MALADAVEGAVRPSQSITWQDQDGSAFSLANVSAITARIYNKATKQTADSDGTFTVTDEAAGTFRWDYGTNDVAAPGNYLVQFTATFSSGVTPARTIPADWTIHRAY